MNRKPSSTGLDGEPGQLLVVVAEPTRGGGVGGVSRAQELCGAGRAARLCLSEDAQGLIAGERIAEVAEVDQIDDLLGGQAREQLPQRLASTFGAQVPQGVEHRTRRHVHDALLGAEPPQLGVAGQLTTEIFQFVQRLLDVASDDPAAEGPDGYGLDVVATTGREQKPWPSCPSPASVVMTT